jgi:hypothetical protein
MSDVIQNIALFNIVIVLNAILIQLIKIKNK